MDRAEAHELIDHDLASIPEVRSACLAILDFLSNVDPGVIQRLTFGQLMKTAGVAEPADILPAVQYLTGARLHLLEPKFEFVDALTDFVEEIPLEVVAQARAESMFIHPERGEPVENFEESLFMFFVPSERAKSLSEASSD